MDMEIYSDKYILWLQGERDSSNIFEGKCKLLFGERKSGRINLVAELIDCKT